MRAQRGFTVVEVLLSVLIFVGLGFAFFGVVSVLLHGLGRSTATQGGALALEGQLDTLRSDAATAFAVFVPAKDVFGNSNASGHEVDFYSRSDSGSPVFWAYYYDAHAQTLRRYDYDTSGNVGEADRTTGAIGAGQRYPAVPDVSSFSARTLEANDLVGSKSAYAPALSQLFSGATPQPLPVGYDDGAAPRADLYGGNTTVELNIASARGTRTLHLASGALPSGFTVHDYPEIRAVVFRHDTTDRHWFGLTQKSYVYVNAELLISWTHFTEAHPMVWCEYNLYGNPGGLVAPLGPDSDYQPTWFPETTAGIVWHVTHGDTNGSHCSQTPPKPGDSVDPSAFFSPPPDVQPTPPPCFYEGQCWPPQAPPDWSPSPAPSMTPPAWWCQGRAESTLCGGTGYATPAPAQSAGPSPAPTPYRTPPGGLGGCIHTNTCGRIPY